MSHLIGKKPSNIFCRVTAYMGRFLVTRLEVIEQHLEKNNAKTRAQIAADHQLCFSLHRSTS